MNIGPGPVRIGKKLARQLLRRLDDAHRHARMESMSVGDISHDKVKPVRHEDGRLVTEATVDEFIRERLRIHHASWVLAPIDEVREVLEHAV